MSFDFLEGAPFTAADDKRAAHVAVISDATRRRLFGDEPGVGRNIDLDATSYRVVGVVRDVPWYRHDTAAEVWVPLQTQTSSGYFSRLLGGCIAVYLLEPGADRAQVQAAFRERLTRVEFEDPERFHTVMGLPMTALERASNTFLALDVGETAPRRFVLICLLAGFGFMLLPAVNLVNINLSRIYERSSEIGVRKAFGAASPDLVLQFVVENVVLCLLGGAIGLAGAFVILKTATFLPDLPYLEFSLNWRIFLSAVVLATVFGLLSGVLAGLEDVAPPSGGCPQRRHIMTRHIFKLVWNRKRSTGLILLEVLICFLVLSSLLAWSLNLVQRWRTPLGFDYDNVWRVDISGMNWQAEDEELEADRRTEAELLRAVGDLPEVEAVAAATNTPFSGSTWRNSAYVDGQVVDVEYTMMTPDLPRVLGLDLVYGRWVQPSDVNQEFQAVVINRRLAHDMFGRDDAIGQDFPQEGEQGQLDDPNTDAQVTRVVGVMEDYRRNGITRADPYVMFVPLDLESGTTALSELLVRVRPGTTADFEETLARTLQQTGPRWSYGTSRLDDARRSAVRQHLTPLIIVAVIALFLIVMVGLGLVGVLWLSVTRRTSELGLRRALGASTTSVRSQILGELWALTALAVTVGTVAFMQLPLFGANFGAGWPVFAGGVILATLITYSFVTFCGLYPTWLATRIMPATALQYE